MMQAIRMGVMQNLFIPELPSPEEIVQLEERERMLQHQREAAAKEVHESAETSGAAEEEPQSAMEGLNRKARRLQQQAQSKGQDVSPKRSDYPEQTVVNAPGSRNKKDDARKKQKAARKDRKRAR